MINAIVQGILLGGLYALFASGLSLIFGVMRIVNLAHGDLAVLAGFLAYVLADSAGFTPFLTLLVVVPVMALLGYALQRGILNFTLGSGELPPLLATFGVAVVLQNALQETFSADSRGLDAGRIEDTSISLGGEVAIGWLPLVTLLVGVAIITGLSLMLNRTQLGRAFRAASDDPEAAGDRRHRPAGALRDRDGDRARHGRHRRRAARASGRPSGRSRAARSSSSRSRP